jgi:hypothetical protein
MGSRDGMRSGSSHGEGSLRSVVVTREVTVSREERGLGLEGVDGRSATGGRQVRFQVGEK